MELYQGLWSSMGHRHRRRPLDYMDEFRLLRRSWEEMRVPGGQCTDLQSRLVQRKPHVPDPTHMLPSFHVLIVLYINCFFLYLNKKSSLNFLISRSYKKVYIVRSYIRTSFLSS